MVLLFGNIESGKSMSGCWESNISKICSCLMRIFEWKHSHNIFLVLINSWSVGFSKRCTLSYFNPAFIYQIVRFGCRQYVLSRRSNHMLYRPTKNGTSIWAIPSSELFYSVIFKVNDLCQSAFGYQNPKGKYRIKREVLFNTQI